MIKDEGDSIELNVIVEKYRFKKVPIKENGKYVLDEFGKKLKQDIEECYGEVIVPTSFLKEGITLYGKSINSKYRVIHTKTSIFDKYTNKFYTVKHTKEELKNSLVKRSTAGFRLSNNK